MLREETRQTRSERVRQRTMRFPTQLLICIEGMERGEPCGWIHHFRLKRLVPFQGIREFLFRAEAVDRLLREPSASADAASLPEEGSGVWQSLPPEYRELNPPVRGTREEISVRFHDIRVKELFTLQISGRQNASLQGWIRGRLTEGRAVGFSSALKLMALLSEERIGQRGEKTDSWEELRQLEQ